MAGDVYTHGHHESVLRSHTWRTIANSAGYLEPQLRSGLDVLDVGCGPGTVTAEFAQRVSPGRVVGMDRNDTVIVKASNDNAADNLSFTVGDVYALDHEDASFDVVHAHQVLQHLSDPVAALREMRRVCRPDGVVAVRDADYGAFTWAPDSSVLDHWLVLYRAVARTNAAEPDAGRYLKAWAIDAGFSGISSSASVWCFTDDADRAWWGGLWADRVVESDFAAQAVERGLATRPELEEMSAAFRSWIPRSEGWFTVLHGEVLATP